MTSKTTGTAVPREMTEVTGNTLVERTYEKRGGWLISWWKRTKTTGMGKDLIITTLESYDHIFLNGKEIPLPDSYKPE